MVDNYTPEIIKTTARRIDYLRTLNNMTLRELSKKSGIAPSALHNIINGNKVPSIYTLLFGWAIHYFEEESIEEALYYEDGTPYKAAAPVAKTTVVPSKKTVAKPKEESSQLSLFDFSAPESGASEDEVEEDVAKHRT